jgi:hypothetical protein
MTSVRQRLAHDLCPRRRFEAGHALAAEKLVSGRVARVRARMEDDHRRFPRTRYAPKDSSPVRGSCDEVNRHLLHTSNCMAYGAIESVSRHSLRLPVLLALCADR